MLAPTHEDMPRRARPQLLLVRPVRGVSVGLPATRAVSTLPPAHLLPVLDQMLTGATDATASRLLNMSPRTFSRRVADLLEYLEVTTRFQGGVEAALRGWLMVDAGPSGAPDSGRRLSDWPTVTQAGAGQR